LGAIPAETWRRFAQSDSFIFAGYNDAIGYGEFIAIEDGRVVREFLSDADCPEVTVNFGRLANTDLEPIESWIHVAGFVDDDLPVSETGLLWIHGRSEE
jgi:hypothetical protein